MGMKLFDTLARKLGYVPRQDFLQLDEVAQEAFRRLKTTHALEEFASYVGLVDVRFTLHDDDKTMTFKSGWAIEIATPAFAAMGIRFEPLVVEEDITDKILGEDDSDPIVRDIVSLKKFRDPVGVDGTLDANQFRGNAAIDAFDTAIAEHEEELPYKPATVRPPERYDG